MTSRRTHQLGRGDASRAPLRRMRRRSGHREAVAFVEAVPTDPGFVLHELPLLRALLAEARGDEVAYRDFVNRYRAVATKVGFEGHIAMAESMT